MLFPEVDEQQYFMGLPQKVINYEPSYKYLLICRNDHEEVHWQAEKAIDNCWVCGKLTK